MRGNLRVKTVGDNSDDTIIEWVDEDGNKVSETPYLRSFHLSLVTLEQVVATAEICGPEVEATLTVGTLSSFTLEELVDELNRRVVR